MEQCNIMVPHYGEWSAQVLLWCVSSFLENMNDLTQIFGIGFRKAIQVCDQSGFNDNIKVNKLTKYQIDQIIKIIN